VNALPVEAGGAGGANAATPPPPSDMLVLRLYVTGNTLRSTRAVDNARRLLEVHAAGRFELEVIDIYLHPEAAVAAQIIAAPTLVKLHPGPLRRVIGDLSDSNKVLAALGVMVSNAAGDAYSSASSGSSSGSSSGASASASIKS
jgi:circadian clock protein KaiB